MKDVRIIPPKLKENKKLRVAGAAVCQNGFYDEGIIRNEVDKIKVLGKYILIFLKDGVQEKNCSKTVDL